MIKKHVTTGDVWLCLSLYSPLFCHNHSCISCCLHTVVCIITTIQLGNTLFKAAIENVLGMAAFSFCLGPCIPAVTGGGGCLRAICSLNLDHNFTCANWAFMCKHALGGTEWVSNGLAVFIELCFCLETDGFLSSAAEERWRSCLWVCHLLTFTLAKKLKDARNSPCCCIIN